MKKLLIIALFLLSILLVSCNTKTPSESVANVSTEDTTSHVHDFSGELKYDELGHFATCECGEVRRSKHIMKTVNVIKEATCIEEGTKETKCKDCEYGKVVTSKISHDYKDEFCTMCGSHKPADGMYFEYSDEYEGWIVKYKDVGDNWDRFLTQLIELYIPTYTDTGEKVVGIGDFSEFEGGRKKVVIPEGIKYILPEAFKNCLSLHEVELPSDPSSAIEIYDRVFFNCRNLEKINLNNSVVYLGEFAFWGCRSLESVVIPSSITKLNYGMFQDCTFLKKVVIPDTVTEMGENVFAYCFYLEELDLGNGITIIPYGTFNFCDSFETIVIPDSVTEIGRAFYCEKLKTVVLPKNLKKICEYDFAGCPSLESITIPKSVEYLEEDLFNNCKMLEEINYEGTKEEWNNISFVGSVFEYSFVKRIICSDGIIEVIKDWPDVDC